MKTLTLPLTAGAFKCHQYPGIQWSAQTQKCKQYTYSYTFLLSAVNQWQQFLKELSQYLSEMTLSFCVPVVNALEKTSILGMDFVCPKWRQSVCKVLIFCSVLNKSGTYGQALVNVPNIKFHNNLSHGR